MKEFIDKLITRIMLESASCKVYKLINPNKEDIAEFNAYKKCIEIINQLATEYKNTNIITDFLQYARDNADNYDTNEGWSLTDLIDLSIKFTEEYSAKTPQNSAVNPTTNADRIRSMTDEELAEFLGGIDHTVDEWNCIVKFGNVQLQDNKADILDWLKSEAEGVTENE